MEESAERLTSTPLPDDHSSYTAHDYTGQEVEVENTSITLGDLIYFAPLQMQHFVIPTEVPSGRSLYVKPSTSCSYLQNSAGTAPFTAARDLGEKGFS